MAIVALFGQPLPQAFDLLTQAALLLGVLLENGVLLSEHCLLLRDEFVSLRQLLPQSLVLCSQSDQFFFHRHARTLLDLTPFGKSPADLGCYPILASQKATWISFRHLPYAINAAA